MEVTRLGDTKPVYTEGQIYLFLGKTVYNGQPQVTKRVKMPPITLSATYHPTH